MNLSLRGRVTTSFIVANIMVLALSFTVFHYLNSLNREIESITESSNKVMLITDEIRISAVQILKMQRKILTKKPTQDDLDRISNLCDGLSSQLNQLSPNIRDKNVSDVVTRMQTYVDSLKVVISKALPMQRDTSGMSAIADLADKILEAFSEFQDLRQEEGRDQDRRLRKIINETKRIMMIVLIIGFLFTIILALVVPGKIALPFKKIKDAIRELQDCNFDVSIYYSQDDEIGEIAREMNKMIHNFKQFEELRTDRINVEHRKFDALANMVKKPVMLANAEGNLIYMNNFLYSILQVQTEDVIGKTMQETLMPDSIIEAYEVAIKRRSKIENAEVIIYTREHEAEREENDALDADGNPLPAKQEDIIFKGYANVIPIRGKESSLDYYLMVLSSEVFA
ncbi:MAG: hypothetical protein COW00_02670 [Bdellovibrio sp. CG12_big_fil_rev_8_21_14_0_65_39_13]|nr:MAG: hypothetical protein COW78_03935 [Bdellovibrio sp. CG22_combo_CG10-13_8_21_14_all_39_27]PIQ61961.1 MAG: hypothetical protein COW00_02670 [Bdellovibrio sp. CG12_big_fil_rev_8_21_14_0_65_39_13]PIR35157.1 MAG: hypothetical protein COV37_10185 [Bdellovibrio sp. CG11_big_fil_rev_8_21_14_0_20_39_38]